MNTRGAHGDLALETGVVRSFFIEFHRIDRTLDPSWNEINTPSWYNEQLGNSGRLIR